MPGILHFHLVRDTHFEFEDSSPNLITSDNQPLPGMDPGMIPVNFGQGALVRGARQPRK